MKIRVLEETKTIISNYSSKFNYFAWPTAVRLQNGKIAVGASGFRFGHICPFGKSVLSFSEDEGKTYTAPAPVIDTVLDDRDAGLCTFGESGLIVTSFNNTRDMQRSHIKGHLVARTQEEMDYISSYLELVTDEEEQRDLGSTYKISNDCGVTFGPMYKSPITSPHGPIQLQNGEILWVGASYGVRGEARVIESYIVKLDGTMEKVGQVEPLYDSEGKMLKFVEPYAVQLKNGRIICHIRDDSHFTTCQSISEDNGRTWSTPVHLLPDYGGAPCHLLEHSSGVLISAYSHRREPMGIEAMFSYDGGETWDTDNFIYNDKVNNDLGYPSTVELEDGSLITVFYAKEKSDGPCVIMQTHWSFEK